MAGGVVFVDWVLVVVAGGAALASLVAVVWRGPSLVPAVVGAAALVAGVVLGWRAAAAKVEVHRHRDGLLVLRRRGRDVTSVAYADVDEVWLQIDRVSAAALTPIPLVHRLRLVEHDGSRHRIPARVERAADLINAVLRACSWPLRVPARAALDAGDPLVFGTVVLDSAGIRIGSAGAQWTELELVRICPDRVEIYRGQKFIPWRSVRFDSVPHPTVFAELVASLAGRVESERPWWSLES